MLILNDLSFFYYDISSFNVLIINQISNFEASRLYNFNAAFRANLCSVVPEYALIYLLSINFGSNPSLAVLLTLESNTLHLDS